MITLLEDPTPIIFLGILAEAVLGVVVLCTGRGVILWAMAAVAVLVLAGIGLEWMVQTERERVEAVLEAVVAAVAANDEQGVISYIDPAARRPRELVRWAFHLVSFTDAKITDLKISLDDTADPPTATAELTGIVWFEANRAEILRESYPSSGTVELRRGPEGWRITDYVLKNDPRT